MTSSCSVCQTWAKWFEMKCHVLLLAGPLTFFAAVAMAQAPALPDASAILRDTQRALPGQALPQLPAPARAGLPRLPDDTVFRVQKFDVRGVTLIPLADVQAVLRPWLHRDVVFADLEEGMRAIADLYLERGWYANVQLPPQNVIDGVVRVDVTEAHFGALRLDEREDNPISSERIKRTFGNHQAAGEPLNLHRMNRAIGLLNDLPGVGIKAALDSGLQPGSTDVVVSFEPKPSFGGSASLDNQGARSTGYARASLNLNLDNPNRLGDQAQANLMASEGVRYVRLGYSLPAGYSGLRAGVNTSALRYHLIGTFDTSDGSYGSASTRSFTLTYPWLRSQTSNVNLAATYTDAEYINYVNGTETSRKTGRTTMLNIVGDFYDAVLGGSTNQWGLSMSSGRMVNQFAKLNANLARIQRLSEATSLWVSWSGQHAFDNLDTSEKFTLGGAQGVRAYPGIQGTGDHGWLLTVEARHNLRPDLQATVFHDHGRVSWSQDPDAMPPDNAQNLNSYSLRGAGLGLRYTYASSTTVNLTWSRRLGVNPVANTSTGADADGTRLLDRFWVNVSSFF
jgi:hemolysin activation/secretion protein